ncbi:hypothetical protein PI125_g7990 [Phytophthora idaei]|nr:hypothetical protein PI125_g7990 [Phytophthora idaei]
MKLFLPDGFVLGPSATAYRDQVLVLGKKAELVVLAVLNARKITSRGLTAVRKHRHDLYFAGALHDLIARHRKLSQVGTVQDPDRQDLLAPAATAL